MKSTRLNQNHHPFKRHFFAPCISNISQRKCFVVSNGTWIVDMKLKYPYSCDKCHSYTVQNNVVWKVVVWIHLAHHFSQWSRFHWDESLNVPNSVGPILVACVLLFVKYFWEQACASCDALNNRKMELIIPLFVYKFIRYLINKFLCYSLIYAAWRTFCLFHG